MAVGISRIIHFADFTVDLRLKDLHRDGVRLKLPGQPFAVLAKLLENPGEVVTRDELRACLWQKETFVDFDHSLNVSINRLRETLCDSVEQPRFIETIPRTGYRFIGPVEVTAPASGENETSERRPTIVLVPGRTDCGVAVLRWCLCGPP